MVLRIAIMVMRHDRSPLPRWGRCARRAAQCEGPVRLLRTLADDVKLRSLILEPHPWGNMMTPVRSIRRGKPRREAHGAAGRDARGLRGAGATGFRHGPATGSAGMRRGLADRRGRGRGMRGGRSARSCASSCGDWRAALTTRGPVSRGAAAKSSVWMPIQ